MTRAPCQCSWLLIGILAFSASTQAEASVRLDLALPGVARSFVKLWTVGDNQATRGIATDSAGRIYTTIDGDVVALLPDGSESWTASCAAFGGCSSVATNGSAVFGLVSAGGMARYVSATGSEDCSYVPGDIGASNQPGVFLATPSYVLIGSSTPHATVVVNASDCGEVYRIPTPNGEKVGALVAHEPSDTLFVSWDEAGSGSPQITGYVLSTGAFVCSYAQEEFFRTLIANGRHHGGFSNLTGRNLSTCALEENFASIAYGDVRDIAHDATRGRIYFLGNHVSNRGLYAVDHLTLDLISVFTNFFDNGLFSLNKMGIGNSWAFVPDGSALATGRIRVLDLGDLSAPEFASFELGRVTRLADRLVDGGLFLTQVQRGNVVNPDTPLVAFDIGDGSFVGHSYLYGDPTGNKYCASCLTQLRWLEANCAESPPTDWDCTLTQSYATAVDEVTLAGLPAGTWFALSSTGAILGSGEGEINLAMTLGVGETRTVRLTQSPNVPALPLPVLAMLAGLLLVGGMRSLSR